MEKRETLLTIIKKEVEVYGGKKRMMVYSICQCGNNHRTTTHTFNKLRSCGCLLQIEKDNNKSLGIKNRNSSVEYKSYRHMKDRCYNVRNAKYQRYGARGIIICDRWLENFDNFLLDIGLRPKGCTSIERIDNNGNYEPSNCKWSYPSEQSNNTSRNVFISYNNETMTVSQWARVLKCKPDYISTRLNYRNWSFDRIYHKAILLADKRPK